MQSTASLGSRCHDRRAGVEPSSYTKSRGAMGTGIAPVSCFISITIGSQYELSPKLVVDLTATWYRRSLLSVWISCRDSSDL